MVVLRRVDVGSAFRVGVVFSALIWVVFGWFFLLFQGLLFSGASADVQGAGLTALCFAWAIGIVINAISGGIVGAVSAILYNATANRVGGLRIELGDDESGDKRTITFDSV